MNDTHDSATIALIDSLNTHPQIRHFHHLHTLLNPKPAFHAHLSRHPPLHDTQKSQQFTWDEPIYTLSDGITTYQTDIHQEQLNFDSILTTADSPSLSTPSPVSPPPPIVNTFALLQYKHLLTKFWSSIGIIHLHEFHINLDVFFGVNCARYIIPSDNFDKGTYAIQFPDEIYSQHRYLPLPNHSSRNSTTTNTTNTTSTTIPINEEAHGDPTDERAASQNSPDFDHKILSFSPQLIFSILAHLHATKQMSPILQHYLTYVISIPSFINLISAIISPHFDFLVPVALPFSPSPAFFHTIFSTLGLLRDDLIVLLQPIYDILLNIGSPQPTPLQLLPCNGQPFTYAQPSPHKSSTLSLLHDQNASLPGAASLRPQSFLINTIIDDGSMNVVRITNGLK